MEDECLRRGRGRKGGSKGRGGIVWRWRSGREEYS